MSFSVETYYLCLPRKILQYLGYRVYLRLNRFRTSFIDNSSGFIMPLEMNISYAGGQSIEWLSALVRNLSLAI